MSESELILVTKRMLWKMIEHEKTLEEFTVEGAVASLLYDKLRERELSQRDYSKIWKWSRNKVRYHWENLQAKSELLWLKSQPPTYHPKSSETEPESPNHHHATTHNYNNTIYSNTKNYNKYPLTQSLAQRVRARERASEFDLTFLGEKDLVYAASIRDALTRYPKDSIDQAYVGILRGDSRGLCPLSSLLELQKNYGHEKLIAAMVYAKSESKGGASLKFLEGIMKRWNAPAAKQSVSVNPMYKNWQPPNPDDLSFLEN